MTTLDWQKSSFSGDQANCVYLAAPRTAPCASVRATPRRRPSPLHPKLSRP